MATSTPYTNLVPKDFAANLAFRSEILRSGAESKTDAEEIWIMCARDPLFFINALVFTYSPKEHPDNPIRPFITYPFQDDALIRINDAIGRHGVGIQKSREMGATWTCLALFLWRWLFKENQSFLLASRNESYIDERGNEKTLFAKLDFILKHLPAWLKPEYTRTDMRLENRANDSKINGESATGDLGRGDRRTAVFWDEVAAWERADGLRALASTASVTNCVIANSTPQGKGDAFHTIATSWPHQIRMHWSDHPEQSRGLYTSRNGRLEILDSKYVFPADYPFIFDGKLRSPYYDDFCIKLPIPSLVAQELDIDFGGSGSQFFDVEMLRTLDARYCTDPVVIGDLTYDDMGNPGEFHENPKGSLRLWLRPNDGKIDPKRSFCLGSDISVGTGASNSVTSIGDAQTGEKVGECINNRMRPEEWARQSVALARWFNDGFMIWENNGPGRSFGATVLDIGYRNVYYKVDEGKFPGKFTEAPGWASTAATKRTLLTEYHVALKQQKFINRSREALSECAEIVYLDDGNLGHQKSLNALDPTGAGDNHADCVIADALCCKGMKIRPQVAELVQQEVPEQSVMWRRMRRKEAEESERSRGFEFS